MNTDEKIRRLEETRIELVRFTHQLDDRLIKNKISEEEHKKLLSEKLCGKTKADILRYLDREIMKARKEGGSDNGSPLAARITAMILIIASIAGIMFTTQGGLTGFSVFAPTQETISYLQEYTTSTEAVLNFTNLTSLRISGTLEGTGAKVMLKTDDAEYLVAELTSTGEIIRTVEYAISTDKREYVLGETVNISITPSRENTSTYVAFNEENKILDSPSYVPEAVGEYMLVALVTTPVDIIRLELNFTVTNSTNSTTAEANMASQEITERIPGSGGVLDFREACIESCTIPGTSNPTMIITLDNDSKLRIESITTVSEKENSPPIQIATVPDMALTLGVEKMVNLNSYFTEPDGEEMHFDISQSQGLTTLIVRDELQMISVKEGQHIVHIYATDGVQMITSNDFTITVQNGTDFTQNLTGPAPMPGENITNNITTENNITNNYYVNVTNNTAADQASNATIVNPPTSFSNTTIPQECSDPDPNKRAPECFEGMEEKYFREYDGFVIEDKGRAAVARFNTLGNLMIMGEVIERSPGAPGNDDFKVGYNDDNDQFITMAWIDSLTGNLNLRGMLHEEMISLSLPPNVYSFQNRRGINLGYIDPRTGDMYVRGNVIPFRKEEQVRS